MELNPNHPVLNEAREHWHKFCAILMNKLGKTEVEITADDVMELGDNQMGIVLDMRGGRCVLRMVSMAEGERLARREGGLPV